MIVKNEEKVIERCLNSIKNIVDEIIIVDTGSKDKTKEICKKYTSKIYDFEWCDDFSKARNYSFSKATGDYIIWLDADDIVPKKSISKLKHLKQQLTADTYMLKYDMAFVDNKPIFSFYRERIIRNCKHATWHGCVHECITPFGKIETLNISIEHRKINQTKSNRNIKIYNKIIKSRDLSIRELYYYGRELFDHKKHHKCIRILNKFLEKTDAWIENKIDACYIISKCYHLLNNHENELKYLFKTFNYDIPRPNICCKIGDYFLNIKNYNLSIYWYLLSIRYKNKSIQYSFMENIYNNYYPYLQLCICYYNMGNIEKSEYYNNLADKYLSSEITRRNKEYFHSLKTKKEIPI